MNLLKHLVGGLIVGAIGVPLGFAASQAVGTISSTGANKADSLPPQGSAAPENSVFPIRAGETLGEYQNRMSESAVSLRDCADLKAFTTDPEKIAYIEKYFGPDFLEVGRFIGGCPDAPSFEAAYKAATTGSEEAR